MNELPFRTPTGRETRLTAAGRPERAGGSAPTMSPLTVNRFRAARGRILRGQIEALARAAGRPIDVLDVGGRADYWANVGLEGIARIEIVNVDAAELEHAHAGTRFVQTVGDARDLSAYPSEAFDLVHANSVIEHVGSWDDMRAMAREVRRVGRAGWIQTPAFEFPVEPHFRLPFVHWTAAPMRRRLLWFAPAYRSMGAAERRHHVDRINLVSRLEFAALFPDATIHVERFALLPKSYVARWTP